jgi:hypothetical protein
MKKLLRLAGIGAAVMLAALALASVASADYGKGALYQVEISANNVGGVPGDGVWLWIALNRDHTGDFEGTDCIHTGSGGGPNGAAHQAGDVTWTDTNGRLVISGVTVIGGQFPVTVSVRDTYGHYTAPSDSVIQNFPFGGIGGTAQVQVAP